MFVVAFLLWIPGLVALVVYGASSQNGFDRPTVLMVGLFWWSIWLSTIWVGMWVCALLAAAIPIAIRHGLGACMRPA